MGDLRIRPLVTHNLLKAYGQEGARVPRESGFGELLKQSIGKVNASQQAASKGVDQVILGQEKDLHRGDLHEHLQKQLHRDLKDLPEGIHVDLEKILERDLGGLDKDLGELEQLHEHLQKQLHELHEEIEIDLPDMEKVHEHIRRAMKEHGMEGGDKNSNIEIRIQKEPDGGKASKASKSKGIKV